MTVLTLYLVAVGTGVTNSGQKKAAPWAAFFVEVSAQFFGGNSNGRKRITSSPSQSFT